MMRIIFLLLFLAVTHLHAEDLVFRARLTEDPGTLDWNWGETKGEIINQMMEGLFATDSTGQPILAVAKEWDWNTKKNELRIKLKPGLKWSDGHEVCAQDFVRSWRRLQDKKFASPYAHYAVPLLKNYSAKGCHELRIRTIRFAPELPALLAHWVFFPQREENLKHNAEAFRTGKGLITNGPFMLKEWQRDQKLILVRNPKYAVAPALDRLEFLFVPEDSTALALYEQKQIDWMKDLAPTLRLEKFKTSGELRFFPSLTSYYFGLNASKSKLLENLEIRRALSAALNRDELPGILGAEARPALRWLPPETMERRSFQAPEKNLGLLNNARVLLQTAVKDGKMDLKLRVYSKPAHKQLAEWAQGQWQKNLGILIPIEVVEEKVYWSEIATNTPPLFLSGVTAPYNHPRAFLQEFFQTSSANWLGWKSPVYDLAVEDQKYIRAEDVLMESAVVIPLYTRASVALLRNEWRGFMVNPLGSVYLKDLKK